jgi:hypothetical protein
MTEGACAVVALSSLTSVEGVTVAAGACLVSVCGALTLGGGGMLLGSPGDPGWDLLEADNYTAAGNEVTYTPTATAVGSDSATLNNLRNLRNTGMHDVIAHGTRDGFTSLDGVKTNGGQLVDAVRANPSYIEGTPCRLMVCHSAVSGVGQQFADEMGVPVLAPTDRVGTSSILGPGQDPIIENAGEWAWLYPRQ